jgi:transaldolase
VKLFCDCADLATMDAVADQVYGFTTNPTLMRQAGVEHYEAFVEECVARFPNHSLSFEVIADNLNAMRYQAIKLSKWGPNVFVKVPVTLTNGVSTSGLVDDLSRDGIRVNVTAVFTATQVAEFNEALANRAECYLSIFAGRIADTGVDPTFLVRQAVMEAPENVSVLWASTREVLNVKHAHDAGAHIITLTPDLLAKYQSWGRDLHEFSRETVQMFRDDAMAAGLTL